MVGEPETTKKGGLYQQCGDVSAEMEVETRKNEKKKKEEEQGGTKPLEDLGRYLCMCVSSSCFLGDHKIFLCVFV